MRYNAVMQMNATLNIRMTDADRKELDALAEAAHLPLATYARQILLRHAESARTKETT